MMSTPDAAHGADTDLANALAAWIAAELPALPALSPATLTALTDTPAARALFSFITTRIHTASHTRVIKAALALHPLHLPGDLSPPHQSNDDSLKLQQQQQQQKQLKEQHDSALVEVRARITEMEASIRELQSTTPSHTKRRTMPSTAVAADAAYDAIFSAPHLSARAARAAARAAITRDAARRAHAAAVARLSLSSRAAATAPSRASATTNLLPRFVRDAAVYLLDPDDQSPQSPSKPTAPTQVVSEASIDVMAKGRDNDDKVDINAVLTRAHPLLAAGPRPVAAALLSPAGVRDAARRRVSALLDVARPADLQSSVSTPSISSTAKNSYSTQGEAPSDVSPSDDNITAGSDADAYVEQKRLNGDSNAHESDSERDMLGRVARDAQLRAAAQWRRARTCANEAGQRAEAAGRAAGDGAHGRARVLHARLRAERVVLDWVGKSRQEDTGKKGDKSESSSKQTEDADERDNGAAAVARRWETVRELEEAVRVTADAVAQAVDRLSLNGTTGAHGKDVKEATRMAVRAAREVAATAAAVCTSADAEYDGAGDEVEQKTDSDNDLGGLAHPQAGATTAWLEETQRQAEATKRNLESGRRRAEMACAARAAVQNGDGGGAAMAQRIAAARRSVLESRQRDALEAQRAMQVAMFEPGLRRAP